MSDVILTHCVQDTARRLILQVVMSLGIRYEGGPGPEMMETFELFICRVVKHTHSQCL